MPKVNHSLAPRGNNPIRFVLQEASLGANHSLNNSILHFMKIALLLLPLLILSSCSLDMTGGGKEKIIELERKVQEEQEKNRKLQAENTELSDQVRKLKAGLWNKEF